MTSDHSQDLGIDLDPLREANRLAASFGATLVKAFSSSVVEGRRFEDVLRSIGQRLVDIALRAATKPLESALGSGIEAVLGGLSGVLPFAKGGVISRGLVQPFAEGGVVARPTYFPLAGGLGLMGERGPEAIMPLARGPDGRLGVRATGGRGAAPTQVTVNITTNDAESFRRSEAQVTAALARAVARGQRALEEDAMGAFHEVRFPIDISLASSGGPERRTDIVLLGSGRESRNARWYHSRRRYEAGYGIKTLDALATALAFFEERRGRLYGFRWRDRLDFKSCLPSQEPAATDQVIGTGDGQKATFQLLKRYGGAHAPYERPILKPVDGSVCVAIDGTELTPGLDFSCDATTGVVTFAESRVPASGAVVTAGYLFDVPVRFDTDRLEIDCAAFSAGAIPSLPVIEIVP